MTEPQRIDIPRPNRSTGPRTPEGKRNCAFNACRHGLTGQLLIITPEEQQAYDKHSRITLEALAPATDYERDLAQSIADDRWRLKRARTIEHGLFAIGMQHGADNTGTPQVDDALAHALAQSRTWMHDARNLQLLTIYEQRIRRAIDKATAQLEAIQTKREQAVKEDTRQAKLLMQLAQAQGRPYQPEAFFSAGPRVRESVFSTPEVARELNRDKLIQDAIVHHYDSNHPKTRAPQHPPAVGHSPESGRQPTTPTAHRPPPTARL